MEKDMKLRKDIATAVREHLNERNDINIVNKYNGVVDDLIDKHKRNLKYALKLNVDDITDRELRKIIFSISNDEPKFEVFFSNIDSDGYKGEVKKINNINTIILYYKVYSEQLNDFYWSVIDNKNKIKYFKNITDLSHNYKIKSTIFHELVHIHDLINYDDTEKMNKKFTKLVNKNNDDFSSIHNNIYSNRTTEYNAYFLQWVDSYLKKNVDVTNFNDFKKHMVNIPIYKNMNYDLKKKYLSRVYSFFQSFQK